MNDRVKRRELEDAVKHPGKFEGEPVYTPYYWGLVLDGGSDQTLYDDADRAIEVFEVTTDERSDFPEISGDTTAIIVWEDTAGFVRSSELNAEEYEGLLAETM